MPDQPHIEQIRGGLCAPADFACGAAAAGIKDPRAARDDLSIISSLRLSSASGTFTTNLVKAAPVRVSMEHVGDGRAQAVVLNSGNANACTGDEGLTNARKMTALTAAKLKLAPTDILVCSTGRIGVPLPMNRIAAGIDKIALDQRSSLRCARSIMTSDTFPKEIACAVETASGVFRIGGIAKGAGMIDPNMATMLCVITTDAAVPAPVLRRALRASVENSFNRITVDGDMSTNDTVIALANGASGIRPSTGDLIAGLNAVNQTLARMIVKDGEGVSKFVEVEVRGAASPADARRAAEAVANSTLVKCAWAGGDPNWGRILDALGYCGCKLDETKVAIDYDALPIVRGGLVAATPWGKLRAIARRKEFRITIDLGLGRFAHEVWTTDLTEEYVRLNLGE